MLTYFPLIVGKCDFIAPDCLPLCLAAVCNEVEGRNDISKHCQRHNRPECWVQLGQSNFFRSYQLQNLNRTSDFDEHRLSRWYALRKYNQGHHEFPPESVIKETKPNCIVSPQLSTIFSWKWAGSMSVKSMKSMLWTNENLSLMVASSSSVSISCFKVQSSIGYLVWFFYSKFISFWMELLELLILIIFCIFSWMAAPPKQWRRLGRLAPTSSSCWTKWCPHIRNVPVPAA